MEIGIVPVKKPSPAPDFFCLGIFKGGVEGLIKVWSGIPQIDRSAVLCSRNRGNRGTSVLEGPETVVAVRSVEQVLRESPDPGRKLD